MNFQADMRSYTKIDLQINPKFDRVIFLDI